MPEPSGVVTETVPVPVAVVLDALPEPSALVDRAGEVAHANPALRRLVGREHRGWSLRDVVAGDPSDLVRRWAASGDFRPGRLTVRVGADAVDLRADGAWLRDLELVLVRLRPLHEGVAPFVDLSRRRETDNLRHLARRLDAALEQVRTVNADLDRYASVVAHDLRGPLATIAGYAALLHEEHADALGSAGLDAVAAIERSAAQMQRVTESLLALARLGTVAPVAEPADTAAALRTAVDLLGTELRGVDVQVGPLDPVMAATPHVVQLFQNLLENSAKFRDADRPLVVRVENGRLGDSVATTVSDNGVGVPADEADVIFEPLVRGRNSSSWEGSGIGLATCRRIVEAYGGTIRCVPGASGGSAFVFTLPAVPAGT